MLNIPNIVPGAFSERNGCQNFDWMRLESEGA